MTRRLAFALTALVLTLATGVTAALAGPTRSTADPGVTPTSILLGTTSPLSGAASAYASVARGADAYFKYVNARGGVNGRKILDTILDDAYNPSQTVQATRQLVEQDKVFAVFNGL
ncbi:MAG TPA: ABC transporter substrate-binding protein, partial [Gaiella sp.]|nr:ABC transporter substrate-binding protein [Gaiella sp.]